MAKTNPIGVRFRQDILDNLKKHFKIDSPQKALVFLERFYVQNEKLAKDITQVLREGQNKPDTALEVKNEGQSIPKEKKGQEKAENGPKTLGEVKALCPKNLVGVHRSIWIAENREKYGL